MPFHRFIDPTYFEAVPLPGSINLNVYDRVNVISGGVGAGGSSPADSAKVGGPTPGTYFVAFGEDGTSLDANRGFRALAENADLLDDLLHRDLAVPKISSQFPNVAGTASFTIVENGVFVGSIGTPSNNATRGGIIGLVDDDGGSSQGQPLHVFTGGAYQAVKITGITGFGTGFGNSPLINVSPTIPAGVAFKVVYYTRQSPASQPEDLVVDLRTFDGAWEADIWAYARNIFETNQTFNGIITFANTVFFSGPVSFPAGLEAPVVINGIDLPMAPGYIALTINSVGDGEGLLITTDSAAGILNADAYPLRVRGDTISSALDVFPNIRSVGRDNTGAGMAGSAFVGIGGTSSVADSPPAIVGISAGTNGIGVSGEGGPGGAGLFGTGGAGAPGILAVGGTGGVGVETQGDLFGVRAEVLVSGVNSAGVYGFTDQDEGWGVWGKTTSGQATSGGVRGEAAAGTGVVGAGAVGVQGVGLVATGGIFSSPVLGALGTATGVAGIGVQGEGTGFQGIGVRGKGGQFGFGVLGTGSSSGGTGVKGISGPLAGDAGVYAQGTGPASTGLAALAFGPGVFSLSLQSYGVLALAGGGFAGVAAVGGPGPGRVDGVIGTAGGGAGNSGSGVLGIGSIGLGSYGIGVEGQGTQAGPGVYGLGGPLGGLGGAFRGGAGGGTGVYAIGDPLGPAGGIGVVGVAYGVHPGVIGVGGVNPVSGLGGGFDAPGVLGIGVEDSAGVVGYAGYRSEGFDGTYGVLGIGSDIDETPNISLYGVLGTIGRGPTRQSAFNHPAGVRGTLDYFLGLAGGDADTPILDRELTGGLFTGAGASNAACFSVQGGYGATVIGSRSKACLKMYPRAGATVPLTGQVGDVVFMFGFGFVVCLDVDGTTGLANWYGIPQLDWTFIDTSPYKSPLQFAGTGGPEPQL